MRKSMLLLNALRAFDATARFLNIAKAAEELSVTQGAVSHHIKKLERSMGVTLFARRNGKLELTASGRELSLGVQNSFRTLERAVDRAIGASDQNVLHIHAMPCFAEMWLIPRVPKFLALHPETQIRISTVRQDRHSLSEGADTTIRYRPGPYPGYKVEKLADEEVFPVCSPTLKNMPRGIEDLAKCPLIHDEWLSPMEAFPSWGDWLIAANVEGVNSAHGVRLNSSSAVIGMAVQGHGIALGRSVLVHDLLRQQRLVRLFDVPYPTTFAYFMVTPKNRTIFSKVSPFREWLIGEMANLESASRR